MLYVVLFDITPPVKLALHCCVVDSTLAFECAGREFESRERLFITSSSVWAFSKLRSLEQCSLDTIQFVDCCILLSVSYPDVPVEYSLLVDSIFIIDSKRWRFAIESATKLRQWLNVRLRITIGDKITPIIYSKTKNIGFQSLPWSATVQANASCDWLTSPMPL